MRAPRRAAVLAVLLALAATPAAAQPQPGADVQPEGVPFELEELPIPVAPALPPADPNADALAISNEVFGPRLRVDAAVGAFQRGYFLTALNRALARAEAGDAAAQTLIAEIYGKGLGVPENLPLASGWYARASENGDALATFELALMYQEGRGVPRNRTRAAELFGLAAARGSIPAKYNLGLLHIEGTYAAPDLGRAVERLAEAAEAGLAEAQYDYGTMLLEGAGVAPNPRAGAAQIELAAAQGLTAAQVDYATLLYLGKGVPRDLAEAVRWYERAAEAGDPVAQNRYAKLLAAGEGVAIDLEAAAMWRALARRQGLTDPVLDQLLAAIPAGTLASAEERARFWPSQPPGKAARGAAPVTPALAP